MIFIVTSTSSFTSTSSKNAINSVRVAVAGRSAWISGEHFPELLKTYDPAKSTIDLPVPLKDNFDLVKKHSEKGAFLTLLPKLDMELSDV